MSTYTPIATQTVASSTASVTFTSIPQNYTDLVLVFSGVGGNNISLQFNGDTSSSYSITRIQGDGSTAGSSRYNSVTSMFGPYSATQNTTIWQIPNYTNTTLYKTGLAKGGGAGTQVELYTGLWQNKAAITSITVVTPSANISAGSIISIYGIAAGNSSAKATGGNIVTTDGTYWYHTFTSSGTFIPKQSLTVDYLVVAGGGGGGSYGGGGGGGGLRCTVGSSGGSPGTPESALSLSANTPYATIVGAGGAGGISTAAQSGSVKGGSGSDSLFATITCIGGGGGAGFNVKSPSTLFDGGSGGGGVDAPSSGTYINGGVGTTNQGFAGGRGYRTNSGYNAGGGGGGAGGAGSDGGGSGTSPSKGTGGSGRSISITGSSITYASGGSGMQESGSDTAGASGAPYTGIGGDSSVGFGATRAVGGNGGSGVVIIRYAV